MSDLISRQAAIDFINAGHLVNPNEPRWSDNEVVNFLKSRPPAQPEIIRCKDCEHYEGGWYCSAWNNSPGFPIVTEEGYCNLAERRTG